MVLASDVRMRSVKDWDPSFSYHATVSSLWDAESASTSPSPSTSIAKTDRASSASVVMTRSEKATLVQAIVGRGVGAAVVGGGLAVGGKLADGAALGADVPQSFSYHAIL